VKRVEGFHACADCARMPITMFRRIPPEYRPYLRRVAMLMVLAAALGIVLAFAIPGGHH
jgi:hypothetical protein